MRPIPSSSSPLSDALADRYRIERELGRGGMATVYLARDLRHDRDVAIKVLHPDLAAALGAERFLTEIKTTAKLQHPHILPLLDSGAVRGAPRRGGGTSSLFYVMPFVAGESLRDRLSRETQLPIDDALRIARQVADALGAAHALGIVHRDIKPENILLQSGHALVADFGIALAVQQAGGQRMTQTGLSLGTPQYMSPEQATGERTVDHRSDLYSLGAVTYEMLTGEPPFTGPTVQAIVAKALTERPTPPRSVRDTIPPNVEAAVLRALAKLPADRFSSASAFVTALETQTTGIAPMAARPRSRVAAIVPWALLVAALALILPGRFQKAGDVANVLRATLPLDLREINPSSIVLSPDARYVAYVTGTGPQRRLHLMSLATGQATPFETGEGSVEPFFSPDGRWLLFFSGTSLRRVPVEGGAHQEVVAVNLGSFRSASWTTPDHIIIHDGGLRRVSINGGRSEAVGTAADSLLRRCIWPIATPDDRHIVCNVGGPLGTEDDILHVVDVATGAITTTGLDARRPIGFRFGHLLYRRGEGVVMAVPFDVRRGRTTGEPLQLMGATQSFSLADNGSAVFSENDPLRRLVLRAGDSSRTVWTPPWPVATPRFSPDGRSIVVRRTDNGGLWLYDLATATSTQVATAGVLPSWTSDGRHIVYVIPTPGMQRRHEVRWRRADLGRPEELLFRIDSVGLGAVHLSPDARLAAFHARGGPLNAVWSITIGSNAPPVPFTGPEEQATYPRFSPDGRWLAYTADESGETKVVVRPASGDGGRITISEPGGRGAVWAPGGRALFYRNETEYVRADLSMSPVPRVTGRSVVLRGLFMSGTGDDPNYDVAPDGQRLLVAEPVSGGRVVIVVNWLEELRSKLRR